VEKVGNLKHKQQCPLDGINRVYISECVRERGPKQGKRERPAKTDVSPSPPSVKV
jgi:hypothetical protein